MLPQLIPAATAGIPRWIKNSPQTHKVREFLFYRLGVMPYLKQKSGSHTQLHICTEVKRKSSINT